MPKFWVTRRYLIEDKYLVQAESEEAAKKIIDDAADDGDLVAKSLEVDEATYTFDGVVNIDPA